MPVRLELIGHAQIYPCKLKQSLYLAYVNCIINYKTPKIHSLPIKLNKSKRMQQNRYMLAPIHARKVTPLYL